MWWLSSAWFCALLCVACAAEDPPIISTKEGAPLLYWNQDLRPLDVAQDRIATITIGLSSLEILERRGDGWVSTLIAAPSAANVMCPGAPAFPVAITAADVNSDGNSDVLVFDSCGNWIAYGNGDGTFRAGAWEEALPHMLTLPYVDVFALQHAETMLFAATDSGGQSVRLGHDTMPQPLSWLQPWLPFYVTNLALRVPALDTNAEDSALLVQGRARLNVVNVARGSGLAAMETLTQTVEPPRSTPFDGIDLLTSLTLPECKPLLLGVGLFVNWDATSISGRNLQLYALADGQYTVTEFDRELQVVTYAAVSRPHHADAIVGIVGARHPGRNVISIWRVSDCTKLELLAESEAEFAWRTPMQRVDDRGLSPVPKRAGVKILGVGNEEESELRFLHYDGFDLRIFSVDAHQDNWTVMESRQTQYVNREDLAFD
jgi:hypothetical protein